jgi:hypothetical protein
VLCGCWHIRSLRGSAINLRWLITSDFCHNTLANSCVIYCVSLLLEECVLILELVLVVAVELTLTCLSKLLIVVSYFFSELFVFLLQVADLSIEPIDLWLIELILLILFILQI